MALDNYSNLKATVKRWTRRNDNGIDEIINDAILLTENKMFKTALKPLRVREMEARATETTPSPDRFLALPDGFLAMRRLTITTNGRAINLQQKDPISMRVDSTSGIPTFFSITSELAFDRVSDTALPLEMVYYKQPSPLNSANPTNIILTDYPNLYLFGVLSAIWLFAGEEDKASFNNGEFETSLLAANKSSRQGGISPGMSKRILTSTP